MMTTDDQLRHLAIRSVEVIAEHQDVGGAYLASPTFPVYRYSWLRDGSFIADAMSRAGEIDSADRFFEWCARTINDRANHVADLVERAAAGEHIAHDEHLPTRFTPDGIDSGEDWWDFQLDGYGAWIWALAEHRRRHRIVGDATVAVSDAVSVCVDYLEAFWAQPCYDWWEEHANHIHTSTLAAIQAGLRSANEPGITTVATATRSISVAAQVAAFIEQHAVVDGHLIKMLGDTRVDASLIAACTPFTTIDPSGAVAEATYQRIVTDLAPDGVHRYLGDTYYGGGRWVVLAGFVGWHEAATGRTDLARARLEWMHRQATVNGMLPEQVTDHSLDPTYIDRWIDKWGPVATPLLWSHAMYITLADALGISKEFGND